MQTFLTATQIIISILLILTVLLQNRDGGLSAVMGSTESFQSTRRGAEKFLHQATILLATLFLLNALAFVLI